MPGKITGTKISRVSCDSTPTSSCVASFSTFCLRVSCVFAMAFLGNKHRRAKITRCRELLNAPALVLEATNWQELFEKLTGEPIDLCQVCGQGRMVIFQELPRQLLPLWRWTLFALADSS